MMMRLLRRKNRKSKMIVTGKSKINQVSDTERNISTTMLVKSDGFGWESFGEVVKALGGKKGKTIRTAGSFWKSGCGLPVGEEITKWTVFKVGDALRQFAFRQNDSAIKYVSSHI